MRRYIFVSLVFVFLTLSAYAQVTPTHIWTGSANTDWNDPHNWDTGSAPQLAPDGNSIVQIKALSSTPALYPVITTNNCHAKELEIKSGASIDLQAQIILTQTSHSCAVKNSGLLKMYGTSAQKTWFEEISVAKKIVLESGSTVHYYDTSTDTLWAGPYENLIVERSISSTNLIVKGNMEVKGSTHPFTITTSTKLEVVGKMHVNTSSLLTLINSPIQIYKDVEIESVSNLTFNNPITLTGNLHNKGSVNIATVNWQPSTDSMTIKNEGELTVTTLNCTPTSSATTLIIEGIDNENKTKITNLSFVGAGGKHLIIKKKIKIDGNIQLSGTSKTSILSVEGDSNDSQLHLATSTTGEGEYLKVYTNIPIVGKNYLAKKSYPHGSDSDIEAGKPEKVGELYLPSGMKLQTGFLEEYPELIPKLSSHQ